MKEPSPAMPDQQTPPDLPPVTEDKLKSIIGIPFESQKPIKSTQPEVHPSQSSPQQAVTDEQISDSQDRKDVGTAYLYWLCLGMHYRYLDRKDTQLIFWVTLGGLGLWWLWDMVRLPDMVRDYNIDLRLKIIKQSENLYKQYPDTEKTTPEIKVHQRTYQEKNRGTYRRPD